MGKKLVCAFGGGGRNAFNFFTFLSQSMDGEQVRAQVALRRRDHRVLGRRVPVQ